MKRVAVIAFTRAGCALALEMARKLATVPGYADASFTVSGPARHAVDLGIGAYEDLSSWASAHFAEDDALVFVGASGIAVRAIAPYVHDKFSDPAVVSIDEAGRFAVPLLSGHVGGANELARVIARITGGQATVSTATDVNGLFSVDEWAVRHGLAVLERDVAKGIAAALLEGAPVGFHSDFEFDWNPPREVVRGEAPIGFDVTLNDASTPFARTLHLVPRIVTVGVGCRRGTSSTALSDAVHGALAQAHIAPCAVSTLASIDVKADEPAIRALARAEGWNLVFYTADELAAVPGAFEHSDFVKRTVGVGNVCERAACAQGADLVVGKQAADGVTVALAVDVRALRAQFETKR